MIMDDHIITALPFYDSTDKQSWNRERCENSRRFCIDTIKNKLPPFQIRRTHSAGTFIDYVYIVDMDGNKEDITHLFGSGSDLVSGSATQNYDNYVEYAGYHDSFEAGKITTTGLEYIQFNTSGVNISVTSGERYILHFNGKFGMTSGTSPDVFIGTASTSAISNVVNPVDDQENIILKVTSTSATAKLYFTNDAADTASFNTKGNSSATDPSLELYKLTQLTVEEFTSYDYIVYEGGDLVEDISSGMYYLEVSDGANTWYSECFNVCDDIDERIVMEWGHSSDIDNIYYSGGFENKIVFAERYDLVKPTYEPTKIGTARDGYFFTEKVVTKKGYKLIFYAPEFMSDAMVLLPSHDTIYLTDKDDNRERVDDVNVNIVATSNCFFRIELEFVFDPIKSGNCNTNIS